MKFYLSSAKDLEPYDDLESNKLMQKYLQKIEEEAGVKVTVEKASELYQHVVVDIPSIKVLAQLMKAIGSDLVIKQKFFIDGDDKYPTICIYDDYIE